jgi:two-component system, sporulation sensor kinase D
MDVYKEKSNLKLILFLLGVFIGLATITYTNHLATIIAKEENRKAKLWADAIERKARLVRYTKDLFTRLAQDERGKVNIWAQSTKFILTVEDNEQLTFFNEIITSNNDIPVILTDEFGNVIATRNIDLPGLKNITQLQPPLQKLFSLYPPIIVDYGTSKNYIYYKDSNLFSKLKNTLNDLVKTFISEVVVNTVSAPVILTDENNKMIEYGNIDSADVSTDALVNERINNMSNAHNPIEVDLGEGVKRFIYYDDSNILKQLRIFPIIQLVIFLAFMLISYFAFSNARRAEQNLVWVGMAKETAHQLGTPISSLAAWVEYLRESENMKGSEQLIEEIENDINRLTLVADRFSKIGSIPQLHAENVYDTLERNVNYMSRRASKNVIMNIDCPDKKLAFKINKQLFDWVLENLLKNALDAMEGEGQIDLYVSTEGKNVLIDVKDTGKGIPKGKFQTIFEPGYSTKRRGWGLGLSLTKRIVEEYHSGKIFVKQSEPGKGTTFRIVVPIAYLN